MTKRKTVKRKPISKLEDAPIGPPNHEVNDDAPDIIIFMLGMLIATLIFMGGIAAYQCGYKNANTKQEELKQN